MTKKSSSHKRGIQRGLPRHRIGGKEAAEVQCAEGNDKEETNLLCFVRSKLTKFAHKCLEVTLAGSQKFHVLGFTRAKNGEYVRLSGKDQIWHYTAIGLCLILCIQKTWGTARQLFYEELGLETFMCLTVALAIYGGVLCAIGAVVRPKETVDLLNSWAQMSACLKQIDSSIEFHPHANISACIKAISVCLVGQTIAIAVPAISLLMSDIPVFWLPTLTNSGILPTSLLPKWAWQIIFALLEWLGAVPFYVSCTFAASSFFIETGALKEYLQQLGKIKVRGLRSRRRLEQMYVQLEVFNRIAQVWIRFYFVPWLLAVSSGVVVIGFMALRYTEVPLFIYVMFPYTAITLLILIFWTSYDIYRVVRASEDILAGFLQHQAPYFQGMTRAERIEKMKRAKAMRILAFSIGDSEFSLNLPISTWDEIINQLLFFLSL